MLFYISLPKNPEDAEDEEETEEGIHDCECLQSHASSTHNTLLNEPVECMYLYRAHTSYSIHSFACTIPRCPRYSEVDIEDIHW